MGDDDVLTGWKEIHQYLLDIGFAVDPKTAQRWHKSRNLPIHKVKGSTGRNPAIWAIKSEIDEWRTPTINDVVLARDRITAIDARGAVAWSSRFADPIIIPSAEERHWRAIVADLICEGKPGVVTTCNSDFQGLPGFRSERIAYFTSVGEREWTYTVKPDLLDCLGRQFENAWSVRNVLVAPSDKGRDVWVAVANRERFAGCVLRIDSKGSAQVFFANSGNVERLCWLPTREGTLIVAAGESNAFNASFVTSFYSHDPPCCSPTATNMRYQYQNAPGGPPRRYVLFPRAEMLVARDQPYGHAQGIQSYEDLVTVNIESGECGAGLIYQFDGRLRPMVVWTSGTHDEVHRRLYREGRLDHPWEACPEVARPARLRVWENASWHEEEIPWRLPQNLT